MFSCILCLENCARKIDLEAKINENKTIKEVIEEQFSYHEYLFTTSTSSSHSICKSCFNSLKNFYTFRDKINSKHILSLNYIKVEDEPLESITCVIESSNLLSDFTESFTNEEDEHPIDIKDLRVILHRIKTEPELNFQEEKRESSEDSDFEWKLDENSIFDVNEELPSNLQLNSIPSEQLSNSLIEKPQNASDSEFKPEKPIKPKRAKKYKIKPKPLIVKTYRSQRNLKVDAKIKEICGLKCNECNKEMESFYKLSKHFKEVHPTIKRYLICCDQKFFRRACLLDHLERHEGKLAQCDICHKILKNNLVLKGHKKELHERPIETSICTHCGKIVKTKSLRVHMKQHLEDPDKTFECYICKKNYINFSLLQKHFYAQHIVPKKKTIRIPCEICSKLVPKTYMKNHIIVNHTERNIVKVQCSICQHWIQSSFLKIHLENHQFEKESCKICGKILANYRAVIKHMKIVHDQEKRFTCDVCGKQTITLLKLKEHIAVVHTKETLYKCRVPGCGREFRAQGNWYQHERRMHKEIYDKFLKPNYKRGPHVVKNITKAIKEYFEKNGEGC